MTKASHTTDEAPPLPPRRKSRKGRRQTASDEEGIFENVQETLGIAITGGTQGTAPESEILKIQQNENFTKDDKKQYGLDENGDKNKIATDVPEPMQEVFRPNESNELPVIVAESTIHQIESKVASDEAHEIKTTPKQIDIASAGKEKEHEDLERDRLLYQVTTPTATRRVQSQRFSREERPNIVPVHFKKTDSISSDEEVEYTVEEPKEEMDDRARMHSSPDIYGEELVKEKVVSVEAMPDAIKEEPDEAVDTEKVQLIPSQTITTDEHITDDTKTVKLDHSKPEKIEFEDLTETEPTEEISDLSTASNLENPTKIDFTETAKDTLISERTKASDEPLKTEIILETNCPMPIPHIEPKIQNSEISEVLKREENDELCNTHTVDTQEISAQFEMKSQVDEENAQQLHGSRYTLDFDRSQQLNTAIPDISSKINENVTIDPTLQSERMQNISQEFSKNNVDKELFKEELNPKESSVIKQTLAYELANDSDTENAADLCDSLLKNPANEATDNIGDMKMPDKLEENTDVLEPLPSLPQSPEKPRALFHIDSDEDTATDAEEPRQALDSESSVEEFLEKMQKDIEIAIEREDASRIGIFKDLSSDSLTKTKELVDERLRKISETKPDVTEEKVEETPVQIGRFQVQAAPDPVVVEKEEKLTEADVEDVIRELQSEGLQPGVYLVADEQDKEKDKKLKRVERRFERMASETLDGEKVESGTAEDKVEAKRELEFERLVSQLSTEEVTECQQSALWDEGGVSSLTPTDDWESRDPDTPHNELDDDSPRQPDIRGFEGSDVKDSQPKTLPTPILTPSTDETTENLSYGDRKKFWESMSSTEKTSFTESVESVKTSVSQETVVLRGRKVEEIKQDIRKSMDETGLVKCLTESYSEKIAAGEMVMPAVPKPITKPKIEQCEIDDINQLKRQSSTDRAVLSELEAKISEKAGDEPITEKSIIAASTAAVCANICEDVEIPEKTLSSESSENIEFTIGGKTIRTTDASDRRSSDAEREHFGASAASIIRVNRDDSVDSEAEFIHKYGEEVVAFENKAFEDEENDLVTEDTFAKRPPPIMPVRKSIYERSMSLPTTDISNSARQTKREFEAQMKKEIIVEQLMAHVEEECSPPEHKSISEIIRQQSVKDNELSPEEIFEKEVTAIAQQTVKELIFESEDIADLRRKSSEKFELELKSTTSTAISSMAEEALQFKRSESVSKPSDSLEVHVDKSETESNEKQNEIDDVLSTIEAGHKIPETASVGESEDTRSESDITPEDCRVVDNEDALWETTVQSGGAHKDEKDVQVRDGQKIGRWIGQENLAQTNWVKEDSVEEFPIETKWERTRSETASPKDPVVYTPEEHYPDTVWEVPVQEQLEDEEIIQDIPIEKQTIVEKDEEDEDDNDQRVMTEAEAREIATDIIEYIEEEVEKRAYLLRSASEEESSDIGKQMDATVSTYIRQLAGEKNLDEREVELIESVLAKKQREEIMKIQRTATGGSSMEITDEELRSSGIESSPRDSLYENKDADRRASETIAEEKEKSKGPTPEDIVTKTIAEARESLGAIKDTLLEHHSKRGCIVAESSTEFEFTSSGLQEGATSPSPKIAIMRESSEDSYDDRVKSPPGPDPSSSSSGEKVSSASKPEIVMRHSSSSSKSSRKTHDRLSAIEMEHYSSSGESHYQSFEGTSSRPCSSDVEAMLGTTGSSEYESALSQSRFTTTGEYVTAKSTLSSRDSSVKSLDSESSGHLGSVEISSDASETLIASALELDRDEGYGVMLLDDDSPDLEKPSRPVYVTQASAPPTTNRPSIDEDFEPGSEAEPVSWTGDVSDDEATEQAPTPPEGIEVKMKRSQEMTFQPELTTLATASSVEASPGDILDGKFVYGSSLDEAATLTGMLDDRLASSLEETGSILSISTASEASTARTIIELSRTESERIETSLTLSAASADSGSREELDSFVMPSIPPTSEMGTSTVTASLPTKTASVTLTTSSTDESGSFCVSTQVTSISRKGSEADDASQSSSSQTEEVESTLKKGHRRKESTSNFVPNMLWTVGETQPFKKKDMDEVQERAESDQYTDHIDLTDKEGKNDEKKESDDSEKTEESHQTEADQAIHREHRKGQIFVAETDRTDSIEEETAEFFSEIQDNPIDITIDFSGKSQREEQVSPVREERSETQSQADFLSEKQHLDLSDKLLPASNNTVSPASPCDIPDITVTQHLKPMVDRDFHYPDLELEEKEAARTEEEAAQTPASISDRGSSTVSTDQGQEYIVNDESEIESKQTTSMTTVQTVFQSLKEDDELSSPTDSFELLDKPDISDEFVIIEEVGKEAQEHDKEGKSVEIGSKIPRKIVKKRDEEEELLESPPAPATKMTDVKYFPGDDGPFQFESESTSSSANSEEMDILQYEKQLEESKKWIEMQFQDQVAGMEYERAPLEDIKEEELNEFDSSSKIGSMGSMKESLGSIGSKGSFGSTPDYDVLAGRKYFTRGDNDDISMSSLQEFELLEKKILDGRKSGSSGSSQDSLNCRKLGTSNKSTGGEDVSGSSLKEFEAIENICVTAVKIENRVKEAEILLSEIEEGHESQVSESESCETMSAGLMEKECDSEDFDRKMFEIDEIIKQAKTNVEGSMGDFRVLDKTESIGRGDSLEEVSKIPDLELDDPFKSKLPKVTYSTQVVTKKQVQKWRAEEGDFLRTSTDSPDHRSGSDSLESKNHKGHSISTDSIEQEAKRKGDIMTDSIEQGDTISIDSFELKVEKKAADTISVDSMERTGRLISEVVSDSLEALHRSDSPDFGEDDAGGAEREIDNLRRPPPRSDHIMGSSDSLGLDPSSSNATHATYQYESDSVMSSSFTSGGSNTLVSDGEHQDGEDFEFPTQSGAWFETINKGGHPFVTETIEKLADGEFSHTVHRTIEMPASVQKVVFTGPGAEEALNEYIEGFDPGENVVETEEIDEHGNVHIKRTVQRRIVVRPDELDGTTMTKDQLQTYFKQFETETYGSQYPDPKIPDHVPTSAQAHIGQPKGEESGAEDGAGNKTIAPERRRQLQTDISMDDEAEYDPTEHDWRQQLQQLHAEADETEIEVQLDAALDDTPVTKS